MSGEILVVDDDPDLREIVRYALSKAGYTVRTATDGARALVETRHRMPDLIVLDILMPELDGIEVCRELRQHSSVPIIFLSSRGEEIDRILGLEMGADDYLTKPFSTRELVTRVKTVLRRSQPASNDSPKVLQSGLVKLDLHAHRAWAADHELTLTLTEFNILQVLITSPGRAFSKSSLIEQAYEHHVSERTLDSHIRRIRQKLRPHAGEVIETVHGLGFRFHT